MKKSTNKIYLYICIFYIIFYITMGVYTPYINVYYERLGFEGSQIGLINSLSLIAAMLITPVWGAISDKTRNIRGMIAFLMIATAISAFFWYQQRAFLPTLILAVILAMFRNNIWSLADGLSVEFCEENQKDFGFARSMGSLGYLLGSFVIANLLFELGISGPYIYVMIVCCLISAFLIYQVPNKKNNDKEERKESKTEGNLFSNLKILFTNKHYVFILILSLLTNVFVDCAIGYTGNHLINTLHQEDSMIGLFSCAQVLPEVIIVMFASRIFRNLKSKQIFMLSAISQLIRYFLCAISSNIVVFLLATTLHGFTIAVSAVGFTSHINKNVDKSMMATAMALYGSSNTIGAAVLNQVFGIIYQFGSSYSIFWLSCFAAVVAGMLIMTNKDLDANPGK